jgi:protein TonB
MHMGNKTLSRERLGLTLVFAIMIHGMLILGVSFHSLTAASAHHRPVEVTIVPAPRAKAPDQADYLAQANRTGSGNTVRRAHPKRHLRSQPPANISSADRTALYDRNSATGPSPGEAPIQSAEQRQLSTRGRARQTVNTLPRPALNQQSPALVAQFAASTRTAEPTAPSIKLPRVTGRKPRVRSVSFNARKSILAAWLDAWRNKVEHIGNVHYPSAIRRRGLAGHLTLEVVINADGSIRSLALKRPSKYPELNAAARRILRLAAPFKPFPPDVRKHSDALSFEYEWRFSNGQMSGAAAH